MYPDLLFYFGIDLVDVIEGRGPSPSLVLSCIQRLPDDSLTSALASPAGRDAFGWGQDRHLLADIYDVINQNTRATGNWGKKGPPKLPPWPRPSSKTSTEKQTVASLFASFQGGS